MIRTCAKNRHVFEGSSSHEHNHMGVTFPYGGPGLHTCLCGEKWKEAPELKVMGIQLGCMADIILKSLIDSYKPPLITPDYYGPLIWE